MMKCIMHCDNPYGATRGINDLARIRIPTAETLDVFYQEWKTTMMEVEGTVNKQDLKAILKQKMEESGLFSQEIRMIDIWDLDDGEKYQKFTMIIEKRIAKEKRRQIETRGRDVTGINNVYKNNHIFHTGDYDRLERRNQPQAYGRMPQTINVQEGKGRGKGPLDRFLETPANRTHPAPYNGRQMQKCRETGTCYAYNMGSYNHIDCKYRHEMVPVEAREVRDTAGDA